MEVLVTKSDEGSENQRPGQEAVRVLEVVLDDAVGRVLAKGGAKEEAGFLRGRAVAVTELGELGEGAHGFLARLLEPGLL